MLEVSDSLILATEKTFYPIAKEIYVLSMDIQSGAYLASAMGVLGMVLLVVSLVISGKVLGERMGELVQGIKGAGRHPPASRPVISAERIVGFSSTPSILSGIKPLYAAVLEYVRG